MENEAGQWSTLPTDILTAVSRRCNSVDRRLLRAVCSSWRASVPLPPKLIPSSLKLPLPNARYGDLNPDNRPGYLSLFQSTVYCLSPLSYPKKGWLVKLLDTPKPNTFALLNPLSSSKFKTTPPNFPKEINLLDYRISEICKSYTIRFVDLENPSEQKESVMVKRIAVLPDGDNFVVLLLRYFSGDLESWKLGQNKWNSIEGKDYRFDDVLCREGKCFAINYAGALFVFDSGMNPIKRISAGFARCYRPHEQKILVEFDGDLYAVDKNSDPESEFYYDYLTDEYLMDTDAYDMPLKLKIFKLNEKINGDDWDSMGRLGGAVFFLGDDVTFGVFKRDLDGCKGDCIYLTDECFEQPDEGEFGQYTGVYDLDERRIESLAELPEYARVFWPPPGWLLVDDVASSSRLSALRL